LGNDRWYKNLPLNIEVVTFWWTSEATLALATQFPQATDLLI